LYHFVTNKDDYTNFVWLAVPVSLGSSSMSFREHTRTRHIREHCSGGVIGPSQRHLHENKQHSQEMDFHILRRSSKPKYRQASSRCPTP